MKNFRKIFLITWVLVFIELICFCFPLIHIPKPETTWTDFVYSDYYKNIIALGFGQNGSMLKIVPMLVQLIIPPGTVLLLRGGSSEPSIGLRVANFFTGFIFLVVVLISAFCLTFTFWGPAIFLTPASIIILSISSLCGFTLIISAFLLRAISGK